MPDWISSRVKSTSVCTSSTPTPSRQGRPSRLTRGDAGSGHRAPLVRAWIASTMYPLGLDRLASTGASLTGSDRRSTRTFRTLTYVSRPWCMDGCMDGQKAHAARPDFSRPPQTFPEFMRSLWTSLIIGRGRITILRRELEISTLLHG